jgi:hypothetical protein
MDRTVAGGQENCQVAARDGGGRAAAVGSRPPVLLTAQESFNQALRRAGERLEKFAAPSAAAYQHPQQQQQHHLQLYSPGVENSPQHAAMLNRSAVTLASTGLGSGCSPTKRRPPFHCDLVSPMKSIRRTLGDITPTKNCRADTADLELPFNFGILQTSPPEQAGVGGGRYLMLPPTPSSSEKSPSFPPSAVGGLFGSPALKLKKRFQERFQEERLISEAGSDYFADPIAWNEEEEEEDDCEVSELSRRNNRVKLVSRYESGDSVLSSPPSSRSGAGREGSPTLLVATALVELYESPSRQQQSATSQEIPLNLTKRSQQY